MELACVGIGNRSQPVVDALTELDSVTGYFVSNRGFQATAPDSVDENDMFVETGPADDVFDSVIDPLLDRFRVTEPDAALVVADFTEALTTGFAPRLANLLKNTSARILQGLAITERSQGGRDEYETLSAVYDLSGTLDTTILYDVTQWSGVKGEVVDEAASLVERVVDLYTYGLADKQSLQDIAWVGKAGGVVLGREELSVQRETSMFSGEMVSVTPTIGDCAEAAVLGKLTAPANLDQSARALLVVRAPEEAATDDRLYAAAERVAEVLAIDEVRVGFVETDDDADASITVAVTAEAGNEAPSEDIIETEAADGFDVTNTDTKSGTGQQSERQE